jgi:hypothetical protein
MKTRKCFSATATKTQRRSSADIPKTLVAAEPLEKSRIVIVKTAQLCKLFTINRYHTLHQE